MNHVLNWSVRVSLFLMASAAIAQGEPIKSASDPSLRRHWAPKFDITLPKGVTSDDLKGRCWSQPALDTYVTQARFWIEDIYGLPYGYVDTHCLKDQLSKANTALNTSYATLLRSLGPAERRSVVAAERLWIVRRNRGLQRTRRRYVRHARVVRVPHEHDDRPASVGRVSSICGGCEEE